MAQESLTFCSRYLSGVDSKFTRLVRNDDTSDQNELERTNSLCPGRPLGVKVTKFTNGKRKRRPNCEIDAQSLAQAHRYVLFNVESVEPYREEHKRTIRAQSRSRHRPQYEIEKIHSQQFSDWFQRWVARLEDGGTSVPEEIKWLARGPNTFVKRFSGYIVNGFRFHTKDHEKYLKSQNSGVVVSVRGDSYASAQDTRPAVGVIKYYGSLKDILQLNYSSKIRVALFRCDWVDINRGCKQDALGATLINFSYLSHTGVSLLDDPFILASQVEKVFYIKDARCDGWLVAKQVKLRDVFDMGDELEPYMDQNANDDRIDVVDLHRTGVDGDDGEDVTSRMQLEDMEDQDEDDQN